MMRDIRWNLAMLRRSLPDKETHDAAVEAASSEAMRRLSDAELLNLRDALRRARDAVGGGHDPKGLDGVVLSPEEQAAYRRFCVLYAEALSESPGA